MQTVVTRAGVTDLLRPDVLEETPTPSPPSCHWLCCPSWRQEPPRRSARRDMPWANRGEAGASAKEIGLQQQNVGLSPDLVSKIQWVGNQRSSLTPSGSHGLTHRVVERTEYPQQLSDGRVEHFVSQTTELIKRPGQTLGIYIREGNGIDRTDGVFISRLHENGEAANSGLLKVGDEIISINSVDVSHMPVDDVVVAMSIPTRLVLRTRFPKNRRGPMADSESKGPLFKLKSTSSFYPPEKTYEDYMEDSRIESQSAMTSLAQRERSERARGASRNFDGGSSHRSGHASLPSSASENTPLLNRSQLVPKSSASHSAGSRPLDDRSIMDRSKPTHHRSVSSRYDGSPSMQQPGTSYQQGDALSRSFTHSFDPPGSTVRRDFATIRSLNSASHLSSAARRPPYDYHNATDMGAFSDSESSRLTATAHVPPPKLYPVSSPQALIRRASSMRSYADPNNPLSNQLAQASQDANFHGAAMRRLADLSPRLPQRFYRGLEDGAGSSRLGRYPPLLQRVFDMDEAGNTSSDSEAAATNYRLTHPGSARYRQRSPFWGDPRAHQQSSHLKPAIRSDQQPFASHKSNSLPKRRGGGRVKWRNDVKGGRNSALGSYEYMQSDSDGAVSAPELTGSPMLSTLSRRYGDRCPFPAGDDAFTSEEYQTWRHADYANFDIFGRPRPRDPRRTALSSGRLTNSAENIHAQPLYTNPQPQVLSAYEYGGLPTLREQDSYLSLHEGMEPRHRSSSLPPKRILQGVTGETLPRLSHFSPPAPRDRSSGFRSGLFRGPEESWQSDSGTLLHRAAGNGRQYRSMHGGHDIFRQHRRPSSISGVLILFILEGRGLKIPERRNDQSDELYCVVEIDGEHRARTSISTYENRYAWNEAFEIDVYNRRQADFFIYSWHTKYKHKLCHRGSLKLDEAYLKRYHETHLSLTEDIGQKFALTLEPRGQLLVRMAYRDLSQVFRRTMSLRRNAYFGINLISLVDRENTGIEVPVLLRRLVEEVERRGIDCNGIYALCGSGLKKQELRNNLEKSPLLANISADAVPDVNVITGVLKDFLRELPEPLVGTGIYQMLWEAVGVCLPEDKEGSVRLVLGVIDCLPRLNKCTLMILMDHLKYVCSHVSQNSMSPSRLCTVFGPLLLCSSNPSAPAPNELNQSDPATAIRVFSILFDLWPARTSSSESSSSDSCTMNMTQHGERSLVEVWMEERRDRESKC